MSVFVISKKLDMNIYNFYKNIDDLYFITSESESNKDKCVNENLYLEKEEFIKKLEMKNIERPGWYYQQFLKYKIIEKSNSNLVHIIDGDSIIKNEMIGSKILKYNQKNINERYKKFYESLFEIKTRNSNCYVTNQMCFEKSIFEKMCIDICADGNYVDKIINAIGEDKKFSEYQTYANYCIDNNFEIKKEKIKVFRRMDLVNDSIYTALKKYDLIAYEPHHKTGLLRLIRAKLFYYFKKDIA